MDHGLPPQSGPVTADTPLSAMPRWTVRLAARPGATRCPSQGLGLQVIAARAGPEHRRERGRSRGRGLGRRTKGTDNIRAEIHCKGSAQALGYPRARPSGRGRPAAAGDRRDSVSNKTHVLAEQFGTTEHDGFRGPYLSKKYPETAFPWTGRSTVQQDVRSATLISERTREAPLPWAPVHRQLQRTRRTG